MFETQVCCTSYCPADHLLDGQNVFRMRPLKEQIYERVYCPIISHYPKQILRPNEFSTRRFPPKAARSTQSLCLGYLSFAAPQLFLGVFSFAQIEHKSDPLVFASFKE